MTAILSLRSPPAHPEFAEAGVSKRMPVRARALLQDFGSMSDEEKPGVRQLVANPGVIHGGHHRLAGPRRRHQKVPMLSPFAGDFDLLEESLLERLESELHRGEQRCGGSALLLAAALELLNDKGLKIAALPVRIKDGTDYWEQVDKYISERSRATFSHSVCPHCYESRVKPELEAFCQTQGGCAV